jgi:hypothetical protein
MWLKNLYENVLVDVKCKKHVFVALKACYNQNRNIITKYLLELNLYVCSCKNCMILLDPKNELLSEANQVFAAELCIPQKIRCSLLNLCCL